VYLHSHYIPSWRWQDRFNFHLFNCTERSGVYMAVLWWVAGLLQVQLEGCYAEWRVTAGSAWGLFAEWRGYCTFSLRVVMVSGGLLQVQLEGCYAEWRVTAGSAWGLFAEWRGYCRFSLRVVMLSGRGIKTRSVEGTNRLGLLDTWRWRQYVRSKRRELVTLLLKSNNTEILYPCYTDKQCSCSQLSLCKTVRQQLYTEFIGP
jgi:hypothetical protein